MHRGRMQTVHVEPVSHQPLRPVLTARQVHAHQVPVTQYLSGDVQDAQSIISIATATLWSHGADPVCKSQGNLRTV